MRNDGLILHSICALLFHGVVKYKILALGHYLFWLVQLAVVIFVDLLGLFRWHCDILRVGR